MHAVVSSTTLPSPKRLHAARYGLLILATAAPLWLGGCDLLGVESASVVAARKEADGKAIGAGCRHAARSVEQCYAHNKKADKAAVFSGWKEMNGYMSENKIEAVPAAPEPPERSATAVASAEEAEPDEKKVPKSATKKP